MDMRVTIDKDGQSTAGEMISADTPVAGRKILVVDDSALMRSALKRLLTQAGHTVDVAEDGREALDMVKQVDYDLVFSDIEMPVMDGVEFIKRCKINSEAAIIVLSSVHKLDSQQLDKIRYFGADGIVAKPRGTLASVAANILAEVDQVLGQR